MIYVKDIIKICDATLLAGDENMLCESFVKDSREVKKGDIYVGIKGDVYNGNNFYNDAFKNGASFCILDNDTKIDDKDKKKNIILVDDTIKAIQELAKYKRSLYDIPVVAITGSVGKTTTKDMISAVLSLSTDTAFQTVNLIRILL